MKTVEELMIKRVEVVGYYPRSPYNIGEILSHIDHLDNGSDFDLYDSIAQEDCCIYAHEVEKYPAIFRPVPWYERREIGDMPDFVKHPDYGYVHMVRDWCGLNWEGKPLYRYYQQGVLVTMSATPMLPATKQEYDSFIKKQNEK